MILVVDDDYSVTASLSLVLKQGGYPVVSAATPGEALEAVGRHAVELVLLDMNFSRQTTGEEGLELVGRLKAGHPDLPVILITAWGSIELAVAGMRAGAADFITKPWQNEQVLRSVRTALGLAASRARSRAASRPPTREELDERYDLSGVIGREPRFLEALALLGQVAATDAPVLITGDSGTGKEAVAEAIHRNSPRREGPFVKVNLGGIGPALFESEMFGHVRGAFTDAHRDRQGRFALAESGTILLDEIGDLDLTCQVKLLRVLQDRTYEVLGSSKTLSLDVRVVSATNRDLQAAVREGRFREDLLYRLNLIAVRLPPLAERREDIPPLARHFLERAKVIYGRGELSMSEATLEHLQRLSWPGNVRQLKHLVERTVLVTEGARIERADLERTLDMELDAHAPPRLPPVGSMTLEEVEKAIIEKSLEHHGGNLSRAAESLGMSRGALYRRLEKYQIKT